MGIAATGIGSTPDEKTESVLAGMDPVVDGAILCRTGKVREKDYRNLSGLG